MSSSGTGLSDVPDDILCGIINRLEVVEFICSGAVSTTWRRLPGRKYCHKTQTPWLMLSSPGKIAYRYFYSITEKKKYDIYLPDIGGRHCVGSSQGFLIFVDNNANLHVTNPMTRAHISLPPTSNSPYTSVHFFPVSVNHRRKYHYRKVILSPSKDIAVTISGSLEKLAFARTGDDKWTALDVLGSYLDDAIFHKDRLHVLNSVGTMAIFDDIGTKKHTLVKLSIPIDNDFIYQVSWYLVESPNEEDLFLVYKYIEDEDEDHPKSIDIRVFLLDKATYTWSQITSLGDVALFVGFNHSMSFCTRDLPGLNRSSIYFTCDYKFFLQPKLAGVMGVFNLEDGSIDPIYFNDDLNWPPPVWFVPTL